MKTTLRHPAESEDCPCGTGLELQNCCGRWHEGPHALQAPTPEALMRSRYCAFVLGRWTYLLQTWHPTTRPPSLEPTDPALRWLGLTIRASVNTAPDRGEVEFIARSKQQGRARRLHERSRFVRENGRWFYVDGDLLGE